MQDFLMSVGLWTVITGYRPSNPDPTQWDAQGAVTHLGTLDSEVPAIAKWDEDDNKAIGSIRLRLEPSIGTNMRSHRTAKELWEALKTSYGTPGVSTIFLDLKTALDLSIPFNSSPIPALDKFQASFERLKDNGVDVPTSVIALIMMWKIPPGMETVAHLHAQTEKVSNLDVASIRASIIHSWEHRNGHKKSVPQNDVRKLSAVKRKSPDPKFKQQQQRPSGGSSAQNDGKGGSSTRRGRRSGKYKPENTYHHPHSDKHAHLVSRMDIPLRTDGPTSTVDPRALAHAPAKMATGALRLPDGPPARVKEAMSLSQRLGLGKPTLEAAKYLYDAVEIMHDGPVASSSRIEEIPSSPKRPRLEERIDWADDNVSLGDDEDLDNEIAEIAGLYRQASLQQHDPSTNPFALLTAAWIEPMEGERISGVVNTPFMSVVSLGEISDLCMHCVDFAKCAACKGKKAVRAPMWLLDSGASRHFTSDINDFVEYEPLDVPLRASTANGVASIIGKGTVII